MRLRLRMIVCLVVLSHAVPLPGGTAMADSPASSKPLVVFLVRHAEKLATPADPGLSEAGKRRAEMLAQMLRNAGVEHIHSSNYNRTRNTAAPLAEKLKVDVELYDPRDLPSLIAELRRTGGRHLVVGHSNTTPQCVQLLGGGQGDAIEEATEYDRLYLVSVRGESEVDTVLLRYGQPAEQ